MTGTRATIPEPAPLSDDEVFQVMVRAFTDGLIDRDDRAPILRMFGQAELIFCLRLGEAANVGAAPDVADSGDAPVRLEARGTAIRLSVEVQHRLKAHFAAWLTAN